MNYFLQLNKKFFLTLIIILSLSSVFFLIFKNNLSKLGSDVKNTYKENIQYDITKPKFTIKNDKQMIIISANGGNFIDKNKILLKDQVTFNSKKFKISSNNVLFDRVNQTAKTSDKSIFKSNKTEIKSQGFNILNQGDILVFNGRSYLTISK